MYTYSSKQCVPGQQKSVCLASKKVCPGQQNSVFLASEKSVYKVSEKVWTWPPKSVYQYLASKKCVTGPGLQKSVYLVF